MCAPCRGVEGVKQMVGADFHRRRRFRVLFPTHEWDRAHAIRDGLALMPPAAHDGGRRTGVVQWRSRTGEGVPAAFDLPRHGRSSPRIRAGERSLRRRPGVGLYGLGAVQSFRSPPRRSVRLAGARHPVTQGPRNRDRPDDLQYASSKGRMGKMGERLGAPHLERRAAPHGEATAAWPTMGRAPRFLGSLMGTLYPTLCMALAVAGRLPPAPCDHRHPTSTIGRPPDDVPYKAGCAIRPLTAQKLTRKKQGDSAFSFPHRGPRLRHILARPASRCCHAPTHDPHESHDGRAAQILA